MYFFYCFWKAKLEHNISVQDCRPECTRKDRAKNMANHPKASTIGNIRHVRSEMQDDAYYDKK